MRYSDGWTRVYANYFLRLKQHDRCAICSCTPPRFAIDHCHRTKEVRGALCYRCNNVLGLHERYEELGWYATPEIIGYLNDPPGRGLAEPTATEKAQLIEVLPNQPWARPYHFQQLGAAAKRSR